MPPLRRCAGVARLARLAREPPAGHQWSAGSVSGANRDFEPALQSLKERVVPMVSQLPGFVSAVWLAPSDGKGHSLAVFQSEEDAQRMVDGLRANPVNPDVTLDSVEIREVVASA